MRGYQFPKCVPLLKAQIRNKIRNPKAHAVVSRLRVQRQDPGSGMGILCSVASGLDRHRPHRIHIYAGIKRSRRGIVDLKAIKQNFSLPLPCA